MELDAIQDAMGVCGRKSLVERSGRMGGQVVQYDPDPLGFGVVDVDEIAHARGEILGGPRPGRISASSSPNARSSPVPDAGSESHMSTLTSRLLLSLGLATLAWLVTRDPAWAQAHNPFSVGMSEGGGSATGISGWLLAEQAKFEQLLSGAVRASKADGSALWLLSGLSFLYGVFHAAGPGHGKAVVASYMFANERALKRGVIVSFLAAVLQGLVAIVLVGTLALVFHEAMQRFPRDETLRDLALERDAVRSMGVMGSHSLKARWMVNRTYPNLSAGRGPLQDAILEEPLPAFHAKAVPS